MIRYVFQWRPKAGQEKDFIAAWQKGSDVIQTYPGARGTKLMRSLDDPSVTYGMAEWDSVEARDAAMAEIAKLPEGLEILTGHEKFVQDTECLVRAEQIAESMWVDN